MKDLPILFSAPMIQAILDGRKTVTRRLPRSQPDGVPICDPSDGVWYVDGGMWSMRTRFTVGRIMWCRETWNKHGGMFSYRADGDWIADMRAQDANGYEALRARGVHPRWVPAIHMPREASRITLRVTSHRVERLHEITEEDAMAEGVDPIKGEPQHEYHDTTGVYLGACYPDESYRDGFASLWDAINGKRCPWSSNPWVERVGFERVA